MAGIAIIKPNLANSFLSGLSSRMAYNRMMEARRPTRGSLDSIRVGGGSSFSPKQIAPLSPQEREIYRSKMRAEDAEEIMLESGKKKNELIDEEITKTILNNASRFAPQVTKENASDYLDWISETGHIPRTIFPSDDELKDMDPIDFAVWKSKMAEGGGYYKNIAAVEKARLSQKTALKKLIDERNSTRKGSFERQLYDQRISKEVSSSKGLSLVTNPDGTFSLQAGGSENNLTTPVETQLQKDVIGLEQRLSDAKETWKTFSKDYLTYGGKVKGFVLKEIDKINPEMLGDDQKQFIQGARVFKENIEQIFNAYRKEITGAQAAMKEISMLRDSIINKNLTPSEFEASYNRYIGQIERSLRLKKYFLEKGINSKKIGNEIDKIWDSNVDVADLRGDEIEAELIKKGLTGQNLQNEVLKQLRTEGF